MQNHGYWLPLEFAVLLRDSVMEGGFIYTFVIMGHAICAKKHAQRSPVADAQGTLAFSRSLLVQGCGPCSVTSISCCCIIQHFSSFEAGGLLMLMLTSKDVAYRYPEPPGLRHDVRHRLFLQKRDMFFTESMDTWGQLSPFCQCTGHAQPLACRP